MLGMIFASAIRDAQAQVDAAKRDRAMIIEEPAAPRFDKFSAEQRPEMPEGFSGNLDTRTVREQIDARQAAKPLQPQVGDVVHVRGTVSKIDSSIRVDFHGSYAFVGPADILSIEPRKPCVGDECEFLNGSEGPHQPGILEAIGKDYLVFRGKAGPKMYFYGLDYLVSRPDFRIVSRASQEKKG